MVHFKLKLDRTSIEHRRPSINVRPLLPEWPEWFQKYHKCLFYPSRTANGIALSYQHRKVKICQSMPRFSRYTRSTYGVRKTTSATQMDVRTWIKCHPRPDKWSSEYTKNAWTLQWRHKEAMASQMTGVSIECSTVGSVAAQRKHQSSASLDFVQGIHLWPVNSPHKRPCSNQ